MNNNTYDEREIDLIDLMWRLLEQWRVLLVMAIIGALIVPLCIGVKNWITTASDSGSMESTEEVVVDSTTQTELDSEYNTLFTTLSMYKSYKTLEYRYQHSILNQIDFQNCISVSTAYEIRLGNADQRIRTMYALYTDITNNEDFANSILALYSSDSSTGSLSDVCSVSGSVPTSDDEADSAVITINTILPSTVDINDYKDALDSAVIDYKKTLENSVGSHGVTLVSTNSRKVNNTTLATTQNAVTTALNTAKSNYETAYKALTDNGKAVMDEIVNDEANDSNSLSEATAELDELWKNYATGVLSSSEVVTANPSSILIAFTIKNIAIGVLAALVLYCGAYVAYMILSRKVKNPEEIENMSGISNYGGIYEYPYSTGLTRFAHDKKIYSIRRKGSSAEKLAEDLVSRLKFQDKSQVHMIVCGAGSGRTDSILQEQKVKLESQGITVDVFTLDKPVSEIYDSQFTDMSAAFLQIISGQTTYNMISELSVKLKKYNVDIVGSEFIEACSNL